MGEHWEEVLKSRLPLYGHRNWIVVADSAYPAQSSEGVETVVAGAEQVAVLANVLTILDQCKHIKPTIYTDRELNFVPEKDAPGVTSYREQVDRLFQGKEVHDLPHERIISKLDHTGRMFRVLLIKTDMCIPYTTIFFELECGYWNAEAENRLRIAMRTSNGKRVRVEHRKRR
jgi:hypothetical protein